MIFGTHYEYPFGGMAARPEWLPRGEQDWRRDLAVIKDTGFDAIRIRIGFDSSIDEVGRLLDLCAELEVGVLFGFATFYVGYAFFEQHPDAKVVDRGGSAYPGGPHDYLWPRACVDHPVYRRRRDELVRASARRFRGHAAILDWDIHNEPNLGVGDHPCYCVHSVAGYRADLERRFGTIEAVNARFATACAGFADLQPPRAADPDAAGRWRDWREFSARRLSAFLLEGANLIRAECPGVRVSFNYTHFDGLQAKGQDWWLLPRLDYTSSSLYHGSGAQTAAIAGAHLALLKALAPEQELWITEFQGGPFPYAGAGRDASASLLWRGIQIEAEVNQVASHGADALFFYRWEPLLSGPEPWINHMVDADEYDTERRLATRRVIAELRGHAELLAGARTVPARVAIYLSREMVWQANARAAPLADTVYGLYGLFLDLGYEVTFVTGGSFPPAGAGLELLAVPFALALSADELEGLTAFVAGGGRVVAELPMTGLDDCRRAAAAFGMECREWIRPDHWMAGWSMNDAQGGFGGFAFFDRVLAGRFAGTALAQYRDVDAPALVAAGPEGRLLVATFALGRSYLWSLHRGLRRLLAGWLPATLAPDIELSGEVPEEYRSLLEARVLEGAAGSLLFVINRSGYPWTVSGGGARLPRRAGPPARLRRPPCCPAPPRVRRAGPVGSTHQFRRRAGTAADCLRLSRSCHQPGSRGNLSPHGSFPPLGRPAPSPLAENRGRASRTEGSSEGIHQPRTFR